ncbi:MAG: hypothetical protein IJP61_08715 [Treponema sp.]|nr:hypothetical protein [Treponema sp.]MBR0032354.1 hypothetical protein [Treponema sp.]
MTKQFSSFFFILLLSFVLFSCASTTTYVVDMESLSSGKNARNYTYKILSSDFSSGQNDLMFISLKNILTESLLKKGFSVTDDQEDANAIIVFNTSISAPNTRLTGMYESGKTSTSYKNVTYTSGTTSTAKYATTYDRSFILDSYEFDADKNSKGTALWKMEILSTGSSNDMKLLLQKFTGMVENYYGIDSNGRKKITLYINDKTLEEKIIEK